MTTVDPGDDFREKLYTIDSKGNRKFVYSNVVKGYFFSRRAIVAGILLLIYLLGPWIDINGRQAILLDIPARRFILFGVEFWATDTLFLMLLLGFLGICLFFFTALFGRVWCGWACPETVFLEFVFRPIERLIEGTGPQRLKLDQAPWNREKLLKKGAKYLIFAALAWLLASTALAYFVGREPLMRMMQGAPAHHPFEFGVTLFLMGLLLFQFGWFREQFCTVLCPYARFQSVMMDPNSLVVGYDIKRGEPRGKAGSSGSTGDCIDCGLCVRVCPTGIDIRNGLQLECVACTACIDACDSIMAKLERPLGLIRYDTENSLLGKRSNVVRPRVLVYSALLIGYLVLFGFFLLNRKTSEFDIIRQRNIPYAVLPDGRISNQYLIQVSNKSGQELQYSLGISDPDVQLIFPGNTVSVKSGDSLRAPIILNVAKEKLQQGRRKVIVELKLGERTIFTREATILGPDA